MLTSVQEAIDDLKQGALKEEAVEEKDVSKKMKSKKPCEVFKPELHSEDSLHAESGMSEEEESEGASKKPKIAEPVASKRDPEASSDDDLFSNRFCPAAVKLENKSTEDGKWNGLPNAVRKRIESHFEEEVLATIPQDLSPWPGCTSDLS